MSLAYNTVRDLNEALTIICTNYPMLKHLNMIKNPMNPMFGNKAKYDEFRATFKIWLPNLVTLDGIDFSKDTTKVNEIRGKVEAEKARILGGGSAGPAEGSKGEAAGGAAATGSGGSKRTYQFNQRAFKKYHSTRSLVERILKSHSEGNRFIRNEDL